MKIINKFDEIPYFTHQFPSLLSSRPIYCSSLSIFLYSAQSAPFLNFHSACLTLEIGSLTSHPLLHQKSLFVITWDELLWSNELNATNWKIKYFTNIKYIGVTTPLAFGHMWYGLIIGCKSKSVKLYYTPLLPRAFSPFLSPMVFTKSPGTEALKIYTFTHTH